MEAIYERGVVLKLDAAGDGPDDVKIANLDNPSAANELKSASVLTATRSYGTSVYLLVSALARQFRAAAPDGPVLCHQAFEAVEEVVRIPGLLDHTSRATAFRELLELEGVAA